MPYVLSIEHSLTYFGRTIQVFAGIGCSGGIAAGGGGEVGDCFSF